MVKDEELLNESIILDLSGPCRVGVEVSEKSRVEDKGGVAKNLLCVRYRDFKKKERGLFGGGARDYLSKLRAESTILVEPGHLHILPSSAPRERDIKLILPVGEPDNVLGVLLKPFQDKVDNYSKLLGFHKLALKRIEEQALELVSGELAESELEVARRIVELSQSIHDVGLKKEVPFKPKVEKKKE